MWSLKTEKIILISAAALAISAALILRHLSGGIDATARAQFLRFVPPETTSVVFVDLDQLRSSPFLAKLLASAPQPAPDSSYTQFVRDSGFNYERDLQKLFIAVANQSSTSTALALAEGNFDRAKIQSFLSSNSRLSQQGGLQVYSLPASLHDQPLSLALLGEHRIAVTTSPILFNAMADAVKDPGHAEWQTRFDRVAGAPAFAVIRQDPALPQAADSFAPGGFRSPQLAALLAQLPWITIACKPDGELLHVVVEGETSSDALSSQLLEFLQGLQLLAQNGLNDAKLRRQMNPDQRAAYLDLLNSADIRKLDRGRTKSVRLILTITPQFLAAAAESFQPQAPQPAEPGKSKSEDKKSPPRKPRPAKRN